MSNLQIIEELCRICEALNHIVRVQADALAQLGSVVMEEERAEMDCALTALIGHDEAPDLKELHEGGITVQAFYFCNGADADCTKEDCHKNGGNCHHTNDRAFAREADGVRLFEETEPGVFFEIDPDDL